MGQVKANDGTVLTPGLGFTSDTDNGWYLKAANRPVLVMAGSERLDLDGVSFINDTSDATDLIILLSDNNAKRLHASERNTWK